MRGLGEASASSACLPSFLQAAASPVELHALALSEEPHKETGGDMWFWAVSFRPVQPLAALDSLEPSAPKLWILTAHCRARQRSFSCHRAPQPSWEPVTSSCLTLLFERATPELTPKALPCPAGSWPSSAGMSWNIWLGPGGSGPGLGRGCYTLAFGEPSCWGHQYGPHRGGRVVLSLWTIAGTHPSRWAAGASLRRQEATGPGLLCSPPHMVPALPVI